MRVVLTNGEAFHAAQVGCSRRLRAILRGREFPGGWDEKRKAGKWESDIQSAAAELAFAKGMDLYWNDAPDLDYDGDVGRWQVRATTEPHHNLIVYDDDPDSRQVVLVCGSIPEFELVGWFLAGDAKVAEWMSGNRLVRAGYIVPRHELHPLGALVPA